MIGNRLRAAREAAGLSLRDLEAAIGEMVSAQAIGKYERSEMMPSSKVLLALAKALRVSPEYLLSERQIELAGIDFRKASHAASKDERAVGATVLEQAERYLELEDLVPGVKQSWEPPREPKFAVLDIESAEEAAEALRKHWNLGIDPIGSIAELLEEKGIKVIAVELPQSVSGSKAIAKEEGADELAIILVNRTHSGERQRFTLAHELAHLVLQFGPDMSAKDQEKAADRFAGAFLIAKKMLKALVGTHRKSVSMGELIALKRVFRVSLACIVARCQQLGVIPVPVAKRLWATLGARKLLGPNAQEPFPIERETPRRMERLCFRAVAEGLISESKAAELLQLPLRELDQRMAGTAV